MTYLYFQSNTSPTYIMIKNWISNYFLLKIPFRITNAFSSLSIMFMLLMSSSTINASHIIGGDITYKCIGNNTFEFTITFYQDCIDGEPEAILFDNPAFYAIYTAGNQPQLFTYGEVMYDSKHIVDPNFSNDCINNYPRTCMQKQTFKFTKTLPANPNGYYIISQRCCRNSTINNIVNPGNVGISYFAKIPGWVGSQCDNNSPIFNKMPPQIICANNPFVYDFSATDSDGDSLSYELCYAKIGGSPLNSKPEGSQITPPPYSSVGYIPPYSANYPVSGAPPLQIDPVTGIMTGTPNIMGRFIVTVCVKEWRDGALLAEYTRDVQFVITNCSKAVIADIPQLSDSQGVHQIVCDGLTVDFKNDSEGGFEYFWDFGVNGATSTEFEPSYTYPDTGKYTVKLIVNPGSTCVDSIEKEVWIYPNFNTFFDWTGNLCPEELIYFNDLSTTSNGIVNSWEWDFNGEGSSLEQNPTFAFDYPGGSKEVTLTTTNTLGCKDKFTTNVDIGYLNVDAGNDTTIVLDYEFKLQGSGASFYQWSPTDYLSDPFIANPDTYFPTTGIYEYVLTGSSETGCINHDTVQVQVVSTGTIFVPSAFSPNNDGLNDVFKPEIIGYAIIRYFKVYDRYGSIVYQSFNNNEPQWNGISSNGKLADVGTYVWEIAVINPWGDEETLSGDVTLLR